MPGILLDPSEVAPSPKPESGPERAGFLIAPSTNDRAQDVGAAAESGPWLLIDPEDIGRPDPAPDASFDEQTVSAEPEVVVDDSAAEVDSSAVDAVEDDQDRLVDLEYLFAASTIDVGPIDLATADELVEIPSEPVIPEPPQIPEIESASTVQVPAPSAIARPVAPEADPADDFDSQDDLDALLAEFSAAMAPAADTSDPEAEPAVDLDPVEAPEAVSPEGFADELPRTTGFGFDDVTVPSAEVIDNAPVVIGPSETVDLNLADITVPSAEVVDHAAALDDRDLGSAPDFDLNLELSAPELLSADPGADVEPVPVPVPEPDPGLDSEHVVDVAADNLSDLQPESMPQTATDPAPAGGLFFETRNRQQPEAPRGRRRVAKSPAEVFASETSLLPARTRRGDQLLVEQHDAGHSWFNKSGELPLLNLADDGNTVQAEPKAGAFVRRTLLTVLILAAIIGCLYVALNSIYL